MKKIFFILCALLISSPSTFAANNEDLLKIVKAYYPIAEQHPGLVNEQDNLDRKKVKTYVVIMKEGVPASFPKRFISWQEHQYAASLVKNGKIKLLRGQDFFRTLNPGEIMMVSGLEAFGKKVWLKLLSVELEKYHSESKSKPAHLSSAFGMQFDQKLLNFPDSTVIVQLLSEWIRPFSSYEAAQEFSAKTFSLSTPSAKEDVKNNFKLREEREKGQKLNQEIKKAEEALKEAEKAEAIA